MAKTEQPTIDRVTVVVPNKIYGTTAEMSALYGLSQPYLKKLRLLRQGPPYRKCGKLVLYSLADFSSWFESVTESHEADPSL